MKDHFTAAEIILRDEPNQLDAVGLGVAVGVTIGVAVGDAVEVGVAVGLGE